MKVFYRHAVTACLAVAVSLPFWFGRLEWDPQMRLWRAIGDGSFVLLFFTLFLGPAARHWRPVVRLLPWRRELGIWFAVLGLAHTLLILDGWVRWDLMRFFGYEFIPQVDRYARLEPGFGLSNFVGIVAAAVSVPLMLSSSNWAVKRLGASSWKWLHYGAYTVFYLVVLHSLYFLFVHFTASFHRPVPNDPNWFRYPFLVLAMIVLAVQASAFAATVRGRTVSGRGGQRRSNAGADPADRAAGQSRARDDGGGIEHPSIPRASSSSSTTPVLPGNRDISANLPCEPHLGRTPGSALGDPRGARRRA